MTQFLAQILRVVDDIFLAMCNVLSPVFMIYDSVVYLDIKNFTQYIRLFNRDSAKLEFISRSQRACDVEFGN